MFVESKSATDFKGFELYTTLSSTSTTDCFVTMFKRKLDKCLMNCADHLRRFNKTWTKNWHSMSNVTNSCFPNKWLCMTCPNNKIRTLIFVGKNCALRWDAYLNKCAHKPGNNVVRSKRNIQNNPLLCISIFGHPPPPQIMPRVIRIRVDTHLIIEFWQ